MPDPQISFVFDSDCLLCSGAVRFVLRHERHSQIRFVAARSGTGVALAQQFGLTPEDLDRTFLVVAQGRGLLRSDAALALAAELRAPARWLTVLRVIPRPLRDAGYDLIARNRYRWFGRASDCLIPPADQRARFVLQHDPLQGPPC